MYGEERLWFFYAYEQTWCPFVSVSCFYLPKAYAVALSHFYISLKVEIYLSLHAAGVQTFSV